MQLTIKNLLLFGLLMGFFVPLSIGQTTFPQNGVYDERDGLYAFTNATIQKSWNEKIENATLLIRNGRIEAVGTGIAVPKDAVVFDLKGRFIYPSFIDPFSNYGIPEAVPNTQRSRGESQQPLSNKRGAYSWNEAMKTEFRTGETFVTNEKDAEILRGAGFGAVLTHRFDGVSRGSGAVILATNDREHTAILKPVAAHIMSFSKGTSTQPYPQSLMGGIALLRQTYLDGSWYATIGVKEERNFSLEAWNSLQSVPQIFAVGDRLEALRAVKLGAEFNKKYIIKGVGDEYQRLDVLKATGSAFILPLAFPETYDVEDPIDAQQVNLADLKHWELAPTNPARLAAAGIEFSLTANGLRAKSDFLKQVQKAIEAGLTEGDALKAMTATPAKMMGVEADLGSLDKGKIANFIVTSAPIFQKDAKIFHNWVAGKGYVLSNDMDKPNLQGMYSFDLIGVKSYARMEITDKNDVTIFVSDSIKFKADIKQDRNNVVMTFTPSGEKDLVRVFGTYEGGAFKGKAQMGDGSFADWQSATLNYSGKTTEKAPEKTDKTDKTTPSVKTALGDVVYPFMAFGNKDLPTAKTVIFKNATVWTNEAEGILKKSDVIISNGKIMFVGENLTAPKDATVVDATGKHLTAGVIDEHSHIAMSRGTNEGTQSCTSEVRVGDIINSDDINIYRQLAGGVTASHILHGSANAIGGQTQLIKLRWGMDPEKMKFENWQGYIKFALGENVKQSNWEIPDNQRIRFPQTRMGVEQVYEDHFTRAKEYLALKNAGKPYRRDLELDALGEILEGKRHITCHSYVQSEITMLIRVADRHGFKVNTFTHILEGYKVADKMAKHGAAGAGFADWWAYKMEVYEAIPHGAKMMQDAGVLSSINSDDAEMARRLNQEAAKTIMYSGNDEVSAWKMVTLNPAKTLRVSDRVGSIKVGKDADVVLWSDNPLSIYAKAEQTYVDGVKYFDRAEDVKAQAEVRKERARLIQKLLASKKSGATTQPATGRPQRLWDCEDVQDEMKD